MLCRHPCIEHAPRPASGSQSPRETLEHPTIAGAPVYPALFLNLPGGGAECRVYNSTLGMDACGTPDDGLAEKEASFQTKANFFWLIVIFDTAGEVSTGYAAGASVMR